MNPIKKTDGRLRNLIWLLSFKQTSDCGRWDASLDKFINDLTTIHLPEDEPRPCLMILCLKPNGNARNTIEFLQVVISLRA